MEHQLKISADIGIITCETDRNVYAFVANRMDIDDCKLLQKILFWKISELARLTESGDPQE
jgi:hypothetical protein